MSKYVKLEDAIHNINLEVTGRKEYTGDMKANLFFALDDLPTIEVSEDCISREWVKGICENMLDEEMLGYMLGYIEDAPSVIPTQNNAIQRVECVEKPREGEWIEILNDRHRMLKVLKCSNCEEKNHFFVEDKRDFCPNCGAKMKG